MPIDALEQTAEDRARRFEECAYPRCEDCDKYHGRYCTVPIVVNKQMWLILRDFYLETTNRLTDLENLVTDEILRSDKHRQQEQEVNMTWADYFEFERKLP